MVKSKKNIYLLGASSLFNDIGSEMLVPIIPFYITALGGTGSAIGLLSGLRTGLSGIFKIFGGWFSDRLGKRKPLIFFGYILSIIFRFLLFFTKSWQMAISSISLERIGKIRDAPRDALIADSTNKKGFGFAIHRTMDTLGAIIGTLLVLFLLYKLNLSFKSIIFIAAATSLISLIPIFFVKEIHIEKTKRTLFGEIHHLKRKLKILIFILSIYAFADFGLFMFMMLKAKEITSSFIIPTALYVLFNLVYSGMAIPFGLLSDKIGRKKVLLFGYLLFIIVCVSFIYANSLSALAILFLLYGVVYASVQSNQTVFVSDFAKEAKGTALGLFQTSMGIASVFGGLVAGYLWDISSSLMFVFVSAIAFLTILMMIFFKEKKD